VNDWTAPGAGEPVAVRTRAATVVPGSVRRSALPPMRPLTPLQMIDGAFALLRAMPTQMLAVASAFVIPPQIAVALIQRAALSGYSLRDVLNDPTTSQGTSGRTTSLALVALLVTSLSFPFVVAAVSRLVAADRLGSRITGGAAIAEALRRAPALLVSWLVVLITCSAGIMGLFLPVPFLVGLSMAVEPAIAVERIGPFAGVRRSWSLCRRRLGACIGVALLSMLVYYAVALGLGGVGQVVGSLAGPWVWVVTSMVGIFGEMVIIPVIATTAVLLYLDLRVRTEGLDLQMTIDEAFGPAGEA
jgi:hypothetical protein